MHGVSIKKDDALLKCCYGDCRCALLKRCTGHDLSDKKSLSCVTWDGDFKKEDLYLNALEMHELSQKNSLLYPYELQQGSGQCPDSNRLP